MITTGKHIRNICSRMKERAAFTLAEALVAIIILLLVTSIVAAGIPAAIRAYDRAVTAANAEVLLSTGMSALRNELSTATMVDAEDLSVTYYSETFGTVSKIYVDEESGAPIMYQRYAAGELIDEYGLGDFITDRSTNVSTPVQLVSEAASDKDKKLFITFKSVDYENGIVTFTDLEVRKNKDDPKDTPAKRPSYSIRVITATE